jgi:hypothetical protein
MAKMGLNFNCGLLSLFSPTGGGRSVGIVRSRTKATEFSLVLEFFIVYCDTPGGWTDTANLHY